MAAIPSREVTTTQVSAVSFGFYTKTEVRHHDSVSFWEFTGWTKHLQHHSMQRGMPVQNAILHHAMKYCSSARRWLARVLPDTRSCTFCRCRSSV